MKVWNIYLWSKSQVTISYLVLILNISKTAGSGALESEIKRGGWRLVGFWKSHKKKNSSIVCFCLDFAFLNRLMSLLRLMFLGHVNVNVHEEES